MPRYTLPEAGPIPRVEAPDVSRFRRDIYGPSRPVVITGAIGHWPALSRWSPASFAARFSSRTVSCYLLRDGEIVRHASAGLVMEDVPAGRFFADLQGQAPSPHRMRSSINQAFPELLDEIQTPEYCSGASGLESYLWVTQAGAGTILHWDLPHNLVAQVSGRKRFILFSPSQTRLLYPHSHFSSTPHVSRIDLNAVDERLYPRFREVRPIECVLEPGELLYLPSRWWHCAESESTTISVNFWWLSFWMVPLVGAAGIYKRLRGTDY